MLICEAQSRAAEAYFQMRNACKPGLEAQFLRARHLPGLRSGFGKRIVISRTPEWEAL